MSIRAELIRLGLRLTRSRDGTPPDLAKMRRGGERMTVDHPPHPPKGTTAIRLAAGGVPAVRVSTPRALDGRHILYLHGGAFVYGSPGLYRDFIWRIVDAGRASALCLDYRLAPEHPFPAAIDDAVSAYRALLAEGADPRRVAIMGDSAGGGLVFSTLLRLRDAGEPLPAAAVAMSPWVDLTLSGDLLRRNAKRDPMLNARHAGVFADWYLNGADPRHPHASPVFSDPTGLPPSLILVGDDEIIHDDSGAPRRAAARRRLHGRARGRAADAACLAGVRADHAGGAGRRRTDGGIRVPVSGGCIAGGRPGLLCGTQPLN